MDNENISDNESFITDDNIDENENKCIKKFYNFISNFLKNNNIEQIYCSRKEREKVIQIDFKLEINSYIIEDTIIKRKKKYNKKRINDNSLKNLENGKRKLKKTIKNKDIQKDHDFCENKIKENNENIQCNYNTETRNNFEIINDNLEKMDLKDCDYNICINEENTNFEQNPNPIVEEPLQYMEQDIYEINPHTKRTSSYLFNYDYLKLEENYVEKYSKKLYTFIDFTIKSFENKYSPLPNEINCIINNILNSFDNFNNSINFSHGTDEIYYKKLYTKLLIRYNNLYKKYMSYKLI